MLGHLILVSIYVAQYWICHATSIPIGSTNVTDIIASRVPEFWSDIDSGRLYVQRIFKDVFVSEITGRAPPREAVSVFEHFTNLQMDLIWNTTYESDAHVIFIRKAEDPSRWYTAGNIDIAWRTYQRLYPFSLDFLGFTSWSSRTTFDPNAIIESIRHDQGPHVIPAVRDGPWVSYRIGWDPVEDPNLRTRHIYFSLSLANDDTVDYDMQTGQTRYSHVNLAGPSNTTMMDTSVSRIVDPSNITALSDVLAA